jgi:signal transduction histidine kinase
MRHQSLRQRLSSLRVGQKIGLGYTLALSIAVCGTIAGFGVGDRYQQQTQERQQHARNKVELLHRLQSRVLQTRIHQQQLIPLARYPEKFEAEYAHLLKHETEIQEIWAELKAFVAKSRTLQAGVRQATITDLFQTYEGIPQLYSQELERRVERIRSLDLASPTDVERAQALMLEFTNSDFAVEFDGISDHLVGLIDQAYQELEVATISDRQVSKFAEKVVVASIGLSVAIAILLAVLTGRAIAKPIQSLTSVARRTTEESNFELQATVEQDDEIGMLANAFNQLIRAVKQLLQQQKTANEQLENYSQTLESQVEVRTQELSDKNTQLQQLLEELQHTQVQMVQSEKMSALGQMVAGVAHEINNPVNFIHGNLTYVQEYAHNLLSFLQLYQNYYPDPAPEIQAEAQEIDMEFIQADLPKVIDSMKLGTDRIRQIVLSLRNFSRMDEADFKAVDIHEGIDSTLLILQHRLKDKPDRPAIQVIRDYSNLPLIECYPGQINQVFMNILANAIDALEEANVKRTYQELKENPNLITIRTAMIDSKWVKIAISDNGMGMPESVQKRLFDPFFTTKSVGKGTGMGLPISYQIVTEKHRGKLDCFSIPGKGTELIVQIPFQQQIRDAV